MESEQSVLKRNVYASMQRLSLGIVWRELQVFSKLLYKSRNQHRRDKSFQKLLRVSKDLQKYQSLSLSNSVKKLWKILPGSGALSVAVAQNITELSVKLVGYAQFTAQLLDFIETTYIDVNVRLCKSLFIPFNLLMLSSLGRIWYCLRYHLQAIVNTHSMLCDCVPANKMTMSTGSLILAPEHRHYLVVPDPPPLGDALGMAVARTNGETLEDIPSLPLSSDCAPGNLQSGCRQGSPHPQLKQAVSVKKPVARQRSKRRIPNTVVCVIRAGKQWLTLKLRCPQYLNALRRKTAFRVRLVRVSTVRRTPWSLGYTALSYRVRIKPVGRSVSECAVFTDAEKITQEQLRNSSVTEYHTDDIDDIFSLLL